VAPGFGSGWSEIVIPRYFHNVLAVRKKRLRAQISDKIFTRQHEADFYDLGYEEALRRMPARA